MSNFSLHVEARAVIGSNKVKKIRVENIIPGVVYSRGEESKSVMMNSADFLKVFKSAGSSSVIDLGLGGEILPVIVKSVQRHPVSGFVTHIDFQKLNMNETIKMTIPISILNRENIKIQPSILMQLMNNVEIECLPSYIPHTADVDVSDIDFDTPKYVKDLDIANMEGITMLTDLEETVCTLSEPVEIEEDEVEVAGDSVDVPVIGDEQ